MTTEEKLNDVIPNPNRSKKVVQEPYEPEYRRLNRDPIVQGVIPIEEFSVRALEIDADYAAVDGITVDEDGKEILPPIDYIIDNNEFIDYRSYAPPPTTHQKVQVQAATPSTTPEVNEYILMVKGKIVQTGELQTIEHKVSAIVYGEDKDFTDASVADIVVLKRVPIKVGVFIG